MKINDTFNFILIWESGSSNLSLTTPTEKGARKDGGSERNPAKIENVIIPFELQKDSRSTNNPDPVPINYGQPWVGGEGGAGRAWCPGEASIIGSRQDPIVYTITVYRSLLS